MEKKSWRPENFKSQRKKLVYEVQNKIPEGKYKLFTFYAMHTSTLQIIQIINLLYIYEASLIFIFNYIY